MAWAQAKHKNGFTIVELLVIIVVIGILAGISVVGYGSWRARVAQAEVKSDLNGVYGAMENARNFGNGYPASIPNSFQPSEGVTVTYISGDERSYCVEARSNTVGSVRFFLNTADGKEPQEGQCAPAALAAPTISSVTVTGTQAVVVWSGVTNATGYDIQRRSCTPTSLCTDWGTTSVNGTSTTISGLAAGNLYDFQVRSKNAQGQSGWSSSMRRAVVPAPTVSSVTSLVCGNSGGTHAWLNGTVTWPATSSAITVTYRFEGDSGQTYGLVPKTVTNPGSGTLSTTASTTRWQANVSGSGTIQLYGIGPNGEKSSPGTWTSPVRPPYDC